MYSKYSAGQRRWSSNIVPRKETTIIAISTRSAMDQRIRKATSNRKMFTLQESYTLGDIDDMISFDTLSLRSVSSTMLMFLSIP